MGFLMRVIRSALLLVWKCHKPLIEKNKELKNIHAGETCFIFANGGSLKYYDVSSLPQIPSIVCSFQLLDKGMESLNVKYNITTDSYSLYSLLYNAQPDIGRVQKNKLRPIFAGVLNKYKNVKTFANITNFHSTLCRRENMHYYYHFGDNSSYSHDLAGSFANCRGALDTMLGVAKYLGFSKAVLILSLIHI